MIGQQPGTQRPKGGIPHDPKSLRTLIFTGKCFRSQLKTQAKADSFSGWLLAGFGAVLALFFANIDKLKGIIETSVLRHAAGVYFATAVLGVAAKIIGLMVTSARKGKSGASALTSDADDIDINLYLESAQGRCRPRRIVTAPARASIRLPGVQRICNCLCRKALVSRSSGDALSRRGDYATTSWLLYDRECIPRITNPIGNL
jgi:hypothetical protein